MTVTASQVVGRSPAIRWAELGGEVVALDERTGALHRLNPTASLVWGCLDGRSALAEIAGDLAAAVGAPVAQVEADVVTLVGQLGELGLLDGTTPATPALGDLAPHAVGKSPSGEGQTPTTLADPPNT